VAEVLTDTLRYEEPIEAPEVVGYQYDGSQQLIAIELADGGWTEYEYDALGRRVAKHHTAGGCQNFRVQGGLRVTRMVERIDPRKG